MKIELKFPRAWRPVLISAYCLAVLTSTCRADQDFGEITADANAIYTGNTYHGYAEVRVGLQNRSHTRTHVVTLISPNQAWNNGNSIGRLSRTVTMAPEAYEVVSLLRPPLPLDGDGQIRVEVDGHNEGQMLAPNSSTHMAYNYGYGSAPIAVTLVSRNLDFNATEIALGTNIVASHGYYGRGGPPVSNPIENLRAETAISDWSESWLAYSPFDAVVLNQADFNSMPPAVLGALGDYLSAGGNIILTGTADLPAAWQPWQRQSLADGTRYEIGFGHCFTFGSGNLSELDAASILALRGAVHSAANYWATLPGDGNAANALFPVVKSLKIPTRGIVVIMLAFVIIIGPVNIIWLSRHRRRTWMLWTIPMISFTTTLLVFAYSLLREGIDVTSLFRAG